MSTVQNYARELPSWVEPERIIGSDDLAAMRRFAELLDGMLEAAREAAPYARVAMTHGWTPTGLAEDYAVAWWRAIGLTDVDDRLGMLAAFTYLVGGHGSPGDSIVEQAVTYFDLVGADRRPAAAYRQ